MIKESTCRVCGETKEETLFRKDSTEKSGYHNICKICHNLARRVPPKEKVPYIQPEYKVCSKCSIEKHRSEYFASKSKDGIAASCKDCRNKDIKKYSQANLEKHTQEDPSTKVINKSCVKCKEVKEVEEFVKDRTRKDGLCRTCKACNKVRSDSYREKNADKIKAKAAQITPEQKAHKKEVMRKWKLENKEILNAKTKEK
jgi:hypothetical protein